MRNFDSIVDVDATRATHVTFTSQHSVDASDVLNPKYFQKKRKCFERLPEATKIRLRPTNSTVDNFDHNSDLMTELAPVGLTAEGFENYCIDSFNRYLFDLLRQFSQL